MSTILLWATNFAPRGWAYCWGQIMSISQNSALFSLLGTTYGGDGITTFGLPDFRGRVPIGAGDGPGLSPYVLGQRGGTENVTLTINQMPMHTHASSFTVTIQASNTQATTSVPSATVNVLAAPYDGNNGVDIYGYTNTAPNTTLNVGATPLTGSIAMAGGSQPFSIIQPYLAVNYIIALTGIFPSRELIQLTAGGATALPAYLLL